MASPLTHHDVIILGAGAAGLMAGIEAAKRGRTVLIVDHARAPGEKIRISGGGRCNFTNLDVGIANYLSRNPQFCRSALSRYTPGHFASYDDLLDYLLFLGKLLPGLVYVLNVREAGAAARSGWWPDDPAAIATLETSRRWLTDAHVDLTRMLGTGRSALLDYEDWAGRPSSVLEAFAGLGLPRDDDAVLTALGTRLEHGPHAGRTA